MRFRKSVNFGGAKLNFSKSGIGASFGIKGFRVGVSPSKGMYTSYGIPGTGIYDVKYHKSNSSVNSECQQDEKNDLMRFPVDLVDTTGCVWGCSSTLFLFIFFPIGIIIYIAWAIWYFKFFKQSAKYKATVLYRKVLKFVENNEYGEAVDSLKLVLELMPNLKPAKDFLIHCLLMQDKSKEALCEIKKYAETDEDKVLLITIAFAAEEFQTVIEYAQSLTGEIRQDTTIITLMGASYYRLQKYDIALEVLLEGPVRKRKMDETIALYRYYLGMTYEALGQKANALKQYNKIVAYNEKYEDVAERIEKLQS